MTWYFDPKGATLNSVEFADGRGNTYTVALDVSFSRSWGAQAPEKAVDLATDWVISQASNGNTQTALTGLVELMDGRWEEGTASE